MWVNLNYLSPGKIKELEDTNAELKIKEEEYAKKIVSFESHIIELKKVRSMIHWSFSYWSEFALFYYNVKLRAILMM